MVEKLDTAFKRCQHCGELFFNADGKMSKNGFICDFCANGTPGMGDY